MKGKVHLGLGTCIVNWGGINLIGFDFTKGVVVKVFDQLRIYKTDEEPGIRKPACHWFMVAASVLHDDPAFAFKGADLPDQIIDLVGCMPDLVRA